MPTTALESAFLASPDPSLQDAFLDAMVDYVAAGEAPDADGLTLEDLSYGVDEYTAELRANAATRYGVAPLRPSAWWYVTGPRTRRTYLGRAMIRHEPVTDLLGEAGSQVWISVRPSLRRRGVGTALLATAIPLARAHGVGHPRIEIAAGNDPARHFLEHFGAEAVRVPTVERERRRRYVLPPSRSVDFD
jgi:GNAT superfamily N-acetyltransferase